MSVSTERLIEVGGATMNVEDNGSGQAVVWLHGGGPGSNGRSAFGDCLPFVPGYRHVVPDFPGFGASQRIEFAGTVIESFAAAVGDVLDELGVRRTVIVGNALGAAVAIKIASDTKDLVEKLVLLAPSGCVSAGGGPIPGELQRAVAYAQLDAPDKDLLAEILRSAVYDETLVDDAMVDHRYAINVRTHPELPFPPVFGDVAAELARIDIPTLILWGIDDRLCPIDSAPVVARALPNARITLLPNCGHWPQIEHLELSGHAIRTFLEEK